MREDRVKPGAAAVRPRSAVGRRGGPGTFGGTNYQVLVAEQHALQMVGTLIWQPHRSPTLSLEPRVADRATGLVGFDVGFGEELTVCEAKVNPSRQDVTEFVGNVAAAQLEGFAMAKFFAGKGGRAVRDLEVVRRVAREAADVVGFETLARDLTDDQRAIVTALGDQAWERAQRIDVEVRTATELEAHNERCATSFAGVDGGRQVRDRLQVAINNAAKTRARIDIANVVAQLRECGVELVAPATTDASGLPDEVARSLLVLQQFDVPVPVDVLARIVGTEPATLQELLADHVLPDGLSTDPPTASIPVYPMPIRRPGEADLFERALEVLTEVVADPAQRPLALTLLRTLHRLALVVHERGRRPDLVSRVFPAGDKTFKTAGDFHLALNSAALSRDASHMVPPGRSTPTPQMVRDRAQTLVCGISWVHQRTGQLDLAEVEAKRSLELGKAIGWQRNTAFCLKCLGRLRRMQAEATTDVEMKRVLLIESKELLEEAAVEFANAPELGSRCADVGDCKSLLARTMLVGGDRRAARRALAEAWNILEEHVGTKDWADAQILDAEILLEEGEAAAAGRRLDDVLEHFGGGGGWEATEIAARAHTVRARVHQRGDKAAAARHLTAAAKLYEHLQDPDHAAAITLEAWALADPPARELTAVVDGEDPLVQVVARRLYESELAITGRRSTSRRSGAPKQKLLQIVQSARVEAEALRPRW